MYPFQFGHLAHTLHQSLGCRVQRVDIVAIETILQFVHLQIVQAFELHVGIRESLTQLRLILRQEVDSGLVALGVDDELCIVVACHLRGVGIHEAWRRTADEACHAGNALILLQHMLHRIGNHLRFGQSLAIRQEYLYGKLVAVGVGEQANLQRGSYQSRQQNDTYAATYC